MGEGAWTGWIFSPIVNPSHAMHPWPYLTTGSATAQSATTTPAKSSTSAPTFFLQVVVVGAGQQVAKDELRHIHPLLLVNLHWDAVAVVPHPDGVALLQAWLVARGSDSVSGNA